MLIVQRTGDLDLSLVISIAFFGLAFYYMHPDWFRILVPLVPPLPICWFQLDYKFYCTYISLRSNVEAMGPSGSKHSLEHMVFKWMQVWCKVYTWPISIVCTFNVKSCMRGKT